jgi:hypothetical protein
MTLKQKFQNEIETESTASLNLGHVPSWGVLIFGEGQVHRRLVSEQSTFQQGGPQPDSFEVQLRMSKEEWAKLSVQLRNRVKPRFNPEELDAIDRFILLASQGSVFDHASR